ncbi:sigma-70 family RNA polymerase sigma factor [Kitasatospora sp. NPDC096147]|uniref:sigma-70 family RNA polymerase sigma factor n=1 Tax=Kitasatospora sp. NPDC096147 TaxID=3364093 RepID=UPI0037FFF2D5
MPRHDPAPPDPPPTPDGLTPSDAELAHAVKYFAPGDERAREAVAQLYRRHHGPVLAYARSCCHDPHTAEDLASEAFACTLRAVRAGRGPEAAWRPYLLAVVRRTAADWWRSSRRTDLTPDFERHLIPAPDRDGGEPHVLRKEQRALVARAFGSLPERWQAVLWHGVVEGESAEQVGLVLGIGASGVGSLAARAREGLRTAYLAAHLRTTTDPECHRYGPLLAASVRRAARRPGRDLARHLADCDRCRRAVAELRELDRRLPAVLPGAVLLWPGSYPTPPALGTAPVGSLSSLGPLGTVLALGAATAALLGGHLLLPDGPTPVPLPPPTPPPAPSAPPDDPSPNLPPSPPPSTSSSPLSPSPSPSPLPGSAPAGATRLRVKATGHCMETGPATGNRPREAPCDGSPRQSWELLPGPRGTVQLRNRATRLCLTHPTALPDGAPVRQQPCGGHTAPGQWWDPHHAPNGEVVFAPVDDPLRRLGLDDWHPAGEGLPHSPLIGVTANYYGTPSLVFLFDGTPFATGIPSAADG